MKGLSLNKFCYCFIKILHVFWPLKMILCLISRTHIVENYGVLLTSCTPYIVHLLDSPTAFSHIRTSRKFQFHFSIVLHVVFSTHIILIISNLKSMGLLMEINWLIGDQLEFHRHKVYFYTFFSTCSCPSYPIHTND